jgi:hypothetical protein
MRQRLPGNDRHLISDGPSEACSVWRVRLWQSNLVALRVDRFVNWKRTRTNAVSLISPTAYVAGT